MQTEFRQITEAEVIHALKNAKKTTQGIYLAVAALVAEVVPGATIDAAQSTNSVYINIPGAKHQIRISDHSKYGANRPTDINGWKSRYDCAFRLNRAVRAAFVAGHSYAAVSTR
jgi:NifU-like protein involved in Fe-S cluster formation